MHFLSISLKLVFTFIIDYLNFLLNLYVYLKILDPLEHLLHLRLISNIYKHFKINFLYIHKILGKLP